MLYNYLLQNYGVGEPILAAEIDIAGMSKTNIRQSLKSLTDDGKLRRYDTGVYYFPASSRLKGQSLLSTEKVIERKYLGSPLNIFGYYSGYTFANMLGVSTQVPSTREVTSNNASAVRREVELGGRKLILRKARTKVTSNNAVILQFLDLLKDLERCSDLSRRDLSALLSAYVKQNNISQKEIDQYLPSYPDKVYKYIYEMRLYDVFA